MRQESQPQHDPVLTFATALQEDFKIEGLSKQPRELLLLATALTFARPYEYDEMEKLRSAILQDQGIIGTNPLPDIFDGSLNAQEFRKAVLAIEQVGTPEKLTLAQLGFLFGQLVQSKEYFRKPLPEYTIDTQTQCITNSLGEIRYGLRDSFLIFNPGVYGITIINNTAYSGSDIHCVESRPFYYGLLKSTERSGMPRASGELEVISTTTSSFINYILDNSTRRYRFIAYHGSDFDDTNLHGINDLLEGPGMFVQLTDSHEVGNFIYKSE